MNHGFLLLSSIFLPALAAAVILLLPPTAVAAIRRLATVSTGLSLLGTLVLLAAFDREAAGYQFDVSASWIPSMGITFSLGVDGVAMPVLLVAAIVGFAAVLLSVDVHHREKEYFVLLLLLVTGGLGAFAARDMFLFYFFFELEVLCSYLLLSIWGRTPGSQRGPSSPAMSLTLFVAAGSLCVIVGLMILYTMGGGSFLWDDLLTYLHDNPLNPTLQAAVFGLFVVGFGIMASMWPFHVWSPPGYAAAPTGVAMLSAGVLKNVGLYGMLKLALPMVPTGASYLAPLLAAVATINMLYAGWAAIRQQDWKYLLAYASISHVGYLLLGIAAISEASVHGVVLLMFAHGLVSALGFGVVGLIEQSTGTRTIGGLGGLARALPFLGVTTVMAVMAICGLPGFANFPAEILIFLSGWEAEGWVYRMASIAAVWTIVTTAVYMLSALRRSFFGPYTGEALWKDPSIRSRLAVVLLLAGLLVGGFQPHWITSLSTASIDKLLDHTKAPVRVEAP